MIKILIDNEEVVSDSTLQIKEEMLSTSSTILKNCYPKAWEETKDYNSNYYFPKDYSKCKIIGGQQTRTGTDFSFRSSDDYFDYKLLGETGGTTGYQEINICGKNLCFNITKPANANLKFFIDKPKKTFTISFTTNEALNGNSLYLEIDGTSYGNIGGITAGANTRVEKTYTLSDANYQAIQNGTNIDLLLYKNGANFNIPNDGMVENNSTATEYEPYKGNTYEVNLGKNLFDINGEFSSTSPMIKYNNGFQLIKNSGNRTLNYIPSNPIPKGTYTLSYDIVSSTLSDISKLAISFFNASNTNILTKTLSSTGSLNCILTDDVTKIYFYINNSEATDTQITLDNVQLEKGSTATSYSPYFTPIVLNEGDYIYKDETWKTYINGTSTDITRDELINELNAVQLRQGLNNISSTAPLEIITSQLIFCGCVKNTGNISLNPRDPHYVDLQILDFKTLLSEGETLNYVITDKTITEAINQVVSSISDYGFVVGNIELLTPNDKINAYSTLNKTAYDVFQYIADITQSKWTTRMIDENTIAIDFYDPTLMPQASPIESTQSYFEQNDIEDISFNYSTNDYRNKQIMTSDEVFANITQTETLIADGYRDSFMCQNKIGIIEKITVNGVEKTFATKSEEELGVSADFIYQPGEMTFNANTTYSAGAVIVITYYAIVKGREIILNTTESTRVSNQIGRKGTISRYENRNDTTSSQELIKIGQSYIKYKGSAEITLKVISGKDLFEVGQIVNYDAPLEELSTDYMVKSKVIDMYLNAGEVFYTYELSSNFNSENAINYFDNQRAKNQGNIGEGETITRNIDLESTALIQFYDTDIEEIVVSNPTSLDFGLDGVLI